MKKMSEAIQGILPKDARGRISSIPGISLKKLLQTDENIAAFGAWRESAIQQLKATAGVTGNRAAQRQFELVIKNDIPQLTDNLPTAMKRLEAVSAMLDSRENSRLKSDLSGLETTSTTSSVELKPTGKLVRMFDKNGNPRTIDESELKEAVSNGWRRAPNGK
jgi:hypothetical protein